MSLIGDLLAPYALISTPFRSIGTIIPDCVVEEIHSDDLAITDHPVEIGATISDHAFMLPVRVQMRCMWSDSAGGSNGWSRSVYERLRSLQKQREPFTVTTGKRIYRNMLVARIIAETNVASEYSLPAVIELREVILTRTSQGQAGKSAQLDPSSTAGTSDAGTVNMQDPTFGSYDVGSNTSFLSPGGSLGIGPTTVEGTVGDIYIDGEGMFGSNPAPDLPSNAVTINPSTLPGNVGFFGQYGPSAFNSSPSAPF